MYLCNCSYVLVQSKSLYLFCAFGIKTSQRWKNISWTYLVLHYHDNTLILITVLSSSFIFGTDEAFINTLVFLLNDDTSGVWSLEHVDASVYNYCTIVGFIINKTWTITDPSYIRCKRKSDKTENHLCQHIRVWYLSHWRAANTLASLCKCVYLLSFVPNCHALVTIKDNACIDAAVL